MADSPAPAPRRGLWSATAAALFASHVAGASLWAWTSPQGFPALHAQWWANLVAPLLVVALGLAGLALLGVGREVGARLVVLALTDAWVGVALGAVVWFPVSGLRMAAAPALLAAALLVLARRGPPSPRSSTFAAMPALVLGLVLPLTQRAPAPDTRPLGARRDPSARSPARVEGDAPGWADLRAARFTADLPGARVLVEPLLTFDSCALDRGWTLFTPGAHRGAYDLVGLETAGATVRAAYARDDAFDATSAVVEARRDGQALLVDATTRLERPVSSHLNAYTRLLVHTREPAPLALVFSPCPDVPIEVGFADYPVGRPMRLAYLDAAERLVVVEASSGEKGPFRELARGPLRRGEALSVVVLSAGAPVARVTWTDWSAQAGTALSPTAGWGLPVNAIEFRLAAGGVLDLWCSLAATSVGRGFQSVGHAAGAYRNRMRVEAP